MGNKILIVDDNQTNLKILELILQKENYIIYNAQSAKEAFELLENKLPTIILADIHMPDINGYEFCKQLKSHYKYKNIPVIFITTLPDEDDLAQGFKVGGVDYITKPFKAEAVRARIFNHLKIYSLQEELLEHNKHLNELVEKQVKQIADTQMETIFSIAKLAQSRDDETGKHLERVQSFCAILARDLHNNSQYADEIDEEFIENIIHTSPLHDIGKVGIADSILLKPGRLTPEEFEIMKTHTIIGAQTLAEVDKKFGNNHFIQMGIVIACSHHERWDGSGYPKGLSGLDIPLAARIMAIADVYDALKSKRIYKEPYEQQRCVEIINEGRGTQFDPVLVDSFNRVKDEFYKTWLSLQD